MANNMAINRNEIPDQYKWRLEDIFQDDPAWEIEYANLQNALGLIPAYEGKLDSLTVLEEALKLLFMQDRRLLALYSYARMRRDEDNNDTHYQALVDRAQGLLVKFSTATAFYAPELLSLDESYLNEAKNCSDFSDYKVYLEELIRRKKHTLTAAEERIVSMAGELTQAPDTIYSMLTDADMKFPTIKDDSGDDIELTHANFIPLMMSRNQAVRKAAFTALYETYQSFAATIPAIYAASVKADAFRAQVAKFPSAIEASLFADSVPLAVYDNLIHVIHDHLPKLNDFMLRNARLNGIENPSMCDVYVPVSLGFDINLDFDAAYDLICDCLSILGDDYIEVLRRAQKERWIDVHPSEGKSAGAYSWGTYDTHPYVLLNHHDDLDGLQTIAHEMGHSLHTYYSSKHQPYPTADYSLFVAEVASTVNEVLVLFALLARHTEKEAQAYLLYNLLDSFRTTVFRQTMFAEFERESHAMHENGTALTIESLNAAYGALNEKYYAKLGQTDLIAHEWMRIPHFYSAFYVYKYATGFSAAMAIATRIQKEGESAVADYKRFLSAGSSLSPIEALKLAGIDMADPKSIESALSMFDALLEKYLVVTETM